MSKNHQKDISFLVNYILPESTKPCCSKVSILDGSGDLQTISPSDKPWDEHRTSAEIVQCYYENSDLSRYSERMDNCSRSLGFDLNPSEEGNITLKLKTASFCRVRHCPVCQWRRSLRWKAKAYQAIPGVVSDHPGYRWLFVTLTVKNCQISELRLTLSEMQKGFAKLVKLKSWPAVGWLRTTEVTRGIEGDAHPHFHCLLLVKAGYFGRGYLSYEAWRKLWKKVMKLDYEPQINIQAISDKKGAEIIIPEILKYCTKESDLLADREWLIELTKQLHKTRSVATGGVLKKYFAELEKEPDDLIGKEEESEEKSLGSLSFGWKSEVKRYKLKD